MNRKIHLLRLLFALCLSAAVLTACGGGVPAPSTPAQAQTTVPYDGGDALLSQDDLPSNQPQDNTTAGDNSLDPNGTYSEYQDVALYLHTYGELPDNFITKSEARELGWDGGSVERYAPGMCIGGDTFGNREGILPQGSYHECDVGTLGEDSRGAERIVWDDEGNIYYTDDHYESFELLYAAG